jgi:hypothetical protein
MVREKRSCEVFELNEAIKNNSNIQGEAVDVANFAKMIFNNNKGASK